VSDVRAIVEAVVKATAKDASEAAVREVVDASLGAVATAAIVSFSGTSVAELAVVVLRVLARVSDATQAKLDLLIRGPIATGLAEVEVAVSVRLLTPEDAVECAERLRVADTHLAQAASLTSDSDDDRRRRALIDLVRAFCATSRRAYGFALHHLSRADGELSALEASVATQKAQLLADIRRFPSHLDPHVRVSAGGRALEQRDAALRRKAADLVELRRLCNSFAQAVDGAATTQPRGDP
jgi:hypothetical protein